MHSSFKRARASKKEDICQALKKTWPNVHPSINKQAEIKNWSKFFEKKKLFFISFQETFFEVSFKFQSVERYGIFKVMLSKVRVATMVTMVTWPAVKWWTSRDHEHASRLRLLRELAEFSTWPKQELFESFVMFKQHLRALRQSEKVSRVLRFEPRMAGRKVKMPLQCYTVSHPGRHKNLYCEQTMQDIAPIAQRACLGPF